MFELINIFSIFAAETKYGNDFEGATVPSFYGRMIDKKHIEEIVQSKLKGNDKFLVDVAVKSGNKISVILDSDTSISIDDCISVSRYIESQFDREVEDFELSVLSFGLDQPLIMIRQYLKYLNKETSILKKNGEKLKGILLEVSNRQIKVRIPANKKKKTEDQDIDILIEDIKETKGIILFKKQSNNLKQWNTLT
ncbi:MAG: ribosome assembly cofactor RimP [Bacteroidetes bacterium]|nr:ribosome assembly cofactor RimP [Bacteroidota bacterium]